MTAVQTTWRVFGASVTGKAHLDKAIACQDAHAHAIVGDVLLAIVCDGAGSARLSEQGAQFIATHAVQALAGRLEQGATLQDLHDGALAGTLAQVRAALDDIARRQRHAGRLRQHGGGRGDGQGCRLLFHLGDGLGVAQLDDGGERISLPANGEYANETYFLSGARWREQLRLLAIPQTARGVVLMSDGCMPFAMSKNNAGLYAPFMDAVQGYLRTVDSVELGNAALAATWPTRARTRSRATTRRCCWPCAHEPEAGSRARLESGWQDLAGQGAQPGARQADQERRRGQRLPAARRARAGGQALPSAPGPGRQPAQARSHAGTVARAARPAGKRQALRADRLAASGRVRRPGRFRRLRHAPAGHGADGRAGTDHAGTPGARGGLAHGAGSR
jgi:hypothetical protein